MNRDDIIKMAREAGLEGYRTPLGGIERFAALVISHYVKENRPKPNATEREWLQQIAYQHGGIGDLCQTELEFGAMVAAAEREACAQLCEQDAEIADFWNPRGRDPGRWFADAIRARGGKK